MTNTTEEPAVFTGCVWYQEAYFLKALQQEVDRARDESSPLGLIFLHVPLYTRGAARHLFAYGQTCDTQTFFGLLSSGDYAICMPSRDFTVATQARVALERAMTGLGAQAGLAMLDEELTAAELLNVSAHACMRSAHACFEESNAA